jgi:hypothetical protein
MEVDTTEDMCLASMILTFLLLFLCVLWIPICLHYCHVLLSVFSDFIPTVYLLFVDFHVNGNEK